MLTKDATYFEEQLRPLLPQISDRSIRNTLDILLSTTARTEKEKEDSEAKPIKGKPRPDGNEIKKLVAKLEAGGLQSIEESAGPLVKTLVRDLMNYALQLIDA